MTKNPHSAADILGAVLESWGGPAQFIAEFRQEVGALPRGHASRIKVYLAIFQELLKTGHGASEQETLEAKREELRRLLKEDDPDEDLDDELAEM